MLKKVEKLIREQSKNLPEYAPARMVGMQLLDIARSDPHAAELLAADLEQSAMGIQDAAKQIKKYADDHHKGAREFCVTPQKAEEILREFYGLGPSAPAPEPAPADGNIINLADFL